MYMNVSRYTGHASRIGEALPKVNESFIPLLRDCPGFRGYAAVASDRGDIFALSIWEGPEALTASRDRIRAWVRENLTGIVPEEPNERFAAEVMDYAAPADGGGGQPLYCMIREYNGVPPEGELRSLVKKVLANLSNSQGFRSAIVLRDPQDARRMRSVAFFDSRESADRLNREITQAAMPAGMMQTLLASGQTAVLALA